MESVSGLTAGGLLVLNKEAGASSNAALQRVRRLLGGIKAGHAGTLDPGAEGVLLVCLGRCTKIIPFLAGLDKEYAGTMKFGEETDTLDGEGRVVGEAPVAHLSRDLIERGMSALVGSISQRPPMYSAVKVGGRRLYELARRGEVVDRPPRTVRVKEFTLLRWDSPKMEFLVRCGGGTYVRSLCHDLAVRCSSAGHMTALTRTAVGPFRLEGAVSLVDLSDAIESRGPAGVPLVPAARALAHLPAVPVDDRSIEGVRNGRPVPPPEGVQEALEEGQTVRLLDRRGLLVAMVCYRGPGTPMSILRVI